MTKMPEPVAEIMPGHTIYWAGTGSIAPLLERTGAKIGDRLITTAQADAYAQAVRREALEEAAKVAMNGPITADMLDSDSAKALAFHVSARIRSLIQKDGT